MLCCRNPHVLLPNRHNAISDSHCRRNVISIRRILVAFAKMHMATIAMPAPTRIPGVEYDPKRKASRLFLLLGLGALDLGSAAEGLLSVLALLACRENVMSAGPVAIPLARRGSDESRAREHVRCCLLGFSILLASPTRTSLK